jgi:hypothetical protein
MYGYSFFEHVISPSVQALSPYPDWDKILPLTPPPTSLEMLMIGRNRIDIGVQAVIKYF